MRLLRYDAGMLYDVHTHVGLDLGFMLRGWWPYAATAQDLLTHMDAHGIDRAVVFPFALPSAFDPYAFADRERVELLPDRVPFDRENELLLQEIERIDKHGRLFMLAMFDPSRKIAEQLANLEGMLDRVAGLKTQSTIIESPIRALLDTGGPLMEFAEAYKMPVLFHTSINPSDVWAQASDCLDVAAAYPKARFNLAHSLRFHRPSLERARTLDNVWVDCSAHLGHCQLAREDSPAVAAKHERVDADYSDPAAVLETLHDMLGGRYLWGSDSPFMSWCDSDLRMVHHYRDEAKVLHQLSNSTKAQMAMHGPQAWLHGTTDAIA